MKMYLKINGTDILPYLVQGGLKWSRNDLESPDAGRTLDGKMWRGRVATKIRLDLTFKELPTDQLHRVLKLLQPEFVTAEYYDPLLGNRSVQMYSNNISAALGTVYDQERQLWQGFSAPLIER